MAEYFVYILRCADDSYYTGLTTDLASRVSQHELGLDTYTYTYTRRPVKLVWAQAFPTHDEGFQRERQIKGWRRSKKEALIRGDFDAIHDIVRKEWEGEKGPKEGI